MFFLFLLIDFLITIVLFFSGISGSSRSAWSSRTKRRKGTYSSYILKIFHLFFNEPSVGFLPFPTGSSRTDGTSRSQGLPRTDGSARRSLHGRVDDIGGGMAGVPGECYSTLSNDVAVLWLQDRFFFTNRRVNFTRSSWRHGR